MKNRLLAFAVLGLFLAWLPAAALTQGAPPPPKPDDPKTAEFKTVTVTGAGRTPDWAFRDAQRKALEEGAGTFIASQSTVKNFQLIEDSVVARSTGWVKSCEKLSEEKLEDGTFQVKIKAEVSIKGIIDAWGTVKNLLPQVGNPKIMVWVSEHMDTDRGGKEVVPDSTVSAVIEQSLLKSGFLLVDHDRIKKLAEKEGVLANIEDKPDKVIALLKQEGAQIFIIGTANSTKGEMLHQGDITAITYEAECNLRGFLEDTGQLVFKIPGKPTRGVQRVWRSAAKQALDSQAAVISFQVTEEILKHWTDWLSGQGQLKLEVEGISFKAYLKLKENLKKVEGIKEVNVQFNNKIATCSIQSTEKAENLAEAIIKTLEPLGVSLEISDVSANTIKAKYTGKD